MGWFGQVNQLVVIPEKGPFGPFLFIWTDPDFDRHELAFYYLRVLEIPTPRWTAYDAKFFAMKDLPAQVDMITQLRAYSSPIWYTPDR